uniref:Uncharacterized protein n=1 Tax=Picea sitchensis TaxID=3332 RepID=D5AE43_PICSI|nr:unknown [Picea sitchensis]
MKNANNSFISVYVLYSRLRIKYLTISSDRLDKRSLNEVLLRHDYELDCTIHCICSTCIQSNPEISKRLWLGLQFDSMRLIFLISNRVCIVSCKIGFQITLRLS